MMVSIILCFISVDYCVSDPCENDAPCTLLADGYTCDCVDGFVGDNCGAGENFMN